MHCPLAFSPLCKGAQQSEWIQARFEKAQIEHGPLPGMAYDQCHTDANAL